MTEGPESKENTDAEKAPESREHVYLCDRCGSAMIEKNCKVICPNCGGQYDCSDLNIYFD